MILVELPRTEARRWQCDGPDGRHFVARWPAGDWVCSCDEIGCAHKGAAVTAYLGTPNIRCGWCDRGLFFDTEIPLGTLSHGTCSECAAKIEGDPREAA